MTEKLLKILIVAPSWVGDMVMSQTLLKQLKSKYGGETVIDILVNSWAKDVVKRMPEVNQVHCNPFAHGELGLFKRFWLGRQLASFAYDQVYVLPNSLKSALVPFFARIKERIGFLGEQRYGLLNTYYKLDKNKLPLMIDRFCALANNGQKPAQIDYPNFTADLNNQTNVLKALGLSLEKPVVCLCPAAEYGPAKRWPTEHFAILADLLQTAGYQVWIMGSAKDADIAARIVEDTKLKANLYDLCGKTNLVDVIDLLAAAKVVVSNDSGLMHVACAVNVPVIAIYGSSSPGFTPPLSDKAQIIKLDLECSPCFERTCKFSHYDCLQKIDPEQIFNAIIKTSPTTN